MMMRKSNDTYGEPQIFEYPDMIIHVYRPILDDAERARRMKQVERAAAALLKCCIRREQNERREEQSQSP